MSLGTDKNPKIVNLVNQGVNHIKDKKLEIELRKQRGKIEATVSFQNLSKVNYIIVCVPTPVNNNHNSDLKQLKSV